MTSDPGGGLPRVPGGRGQTQARGGEGVGVRGRVESAEAGDVGQLLLEDQEILDLAQTLGKGRSVRGLVCPATEHEVFEGFGAVGRDLWVASGMADL